MSHEKTLEIVERPSNVRLSVDRSGALVWSPHVYGSAELEQTAADEWK